MSAMSRRKGAAAEREVFALLSEHLGTVVRRNVDQARNGGADCIEIPGWAVEVKRVESGFQAAWWEQALRQADAMECAPALAYRASRQPWRVRVLLCDAVFALCETPTYDDRGSGQRGGWRTSGWMRADCRATNRSSKNADSSD